MIPVDELKHILELTPLTFEGGFFRETYRSPDSTAIYYLITPDSFSPMHRVAADEIFHFYYGDPVEMLQLTPDGKGRATRLGTNFEIGEEPQIVVPKGTWQGTHLLPDGKYALLGATVAPPFQPNLFELGNRASLKQAYPTFRELIEQLTPSP